MPYTICGKNKGRIKTVVGKFDAVFSYFGFSFQAPAFCVNTVPKPQLHN